MKYRKDKPASGRTHHLEPEAPERFVRALSEMVDAERSRAVRPMITDRIVRTVRAQENPRRRTIDLWSGDLVSWFRPVVAAGILAILLLAAYNIQSSRSNALSGSTTDMVLGLPSVTVVSAYDYDYDMESH